jgi:hypothetical protein
MTSRTTARLLIAGLVATSVLVPAGRAFATGNAASWNPAVTEKLVKLPQSSLKKSLDRDFARSPLADAIANTEEEIKLKVETLGDLRKAAEQAEGALRIELRHQLLAEKRGYLNLVKKRQDLRRQHLAQRKAVYDKILQKVLRTKSANSVETQTLVRQQQEALARFERNSETVDMKVFATFDAPNSEYAREYARNLSAANALMQAINSHPMNHKVDPETPEDKATYLRRLVAESDASLALVTQEDEILGYMAKLVALDAQALSDELEGDTKTADVDVDKPSPLTSALNHFIQ